MLPLPAAGERTRFLPSRRRARGPFVPSAQAGPYRLPASILDRLSRDLAGFRNRDAALALAVMLARFWSAPSRIAMTFPVDRRALTGHADLNLSEARVRGALATLEAIGFLTRSSLVGRTHQRTAEGLHRRPILWRFASDFAALFKVAHAARRETADGNFKARQARHPASRSCPPMRPALALAMSPKGKAQAESPMIMGQQFASGTLQKGSRWGMASPVAPCAALDAALDRLAAARRRSA